MTNIIFYSLIIFLNFLIILWIATRHSEEKFFLRIVVLCSLLYGVLIAVFVRRIFGGILESPTYFPDAYFYHNCAIRKVAEWYGEGSLGYIPLNTRGYTHFIAMIYLIFGPNISMLIFVQLLLASIIPILTFSIARECFSIKTAKLSAFLVAFFPDFYVWASFVLKEIVAVFSIYLAILQFLRFRKHLRLTYFLAMIAPLGFLFFIRAHIALFLAFTFTLIFLWPINVKKFAWLSITVVVFRIFMNQAQLPSFSILVTETPLFIYSRGEILATGTLPELLKITFSSQGLFNFLLGIGRYLLSPLPWKASGAYQAVVPGIILWYFILPTALWGAIRSVMIRKDVYILLIIASFLIFWHGLIVTGTDPRWRLMIVPLTCILGAYGFQMLLKGLSR